MCPVEVGGRYSCFHARPSHEEMTSKMRPYAPTAAWLACFSVAVFDGPSSCSCLNCLTEMIFLSAGLKYHDVTVRIRSNNAGIFWVTESPDEICEKTAPDMTKKNPA